MIDKSLVVHYYRKCVEYRKGADKLYDPNDDMSMCNAAFQLALCGEFALNLLLALSGKDTVRTHNHRVLIKCCGEEGIRIPKEFRVIADDIYEFEAASRYDASFAVDMETYKDVLFGLDKLLGVIDSYYLKPIVDDLRSKLPCSVSGLYSDYEIFTQYYII